MKRRRDRRSQIRHAGHGAESIARLQRDSDSAQTCGAVHPRMTSPRDFDPLLSCPASAANDRLTTFQIALTAPERARVRQRPRKRHLGSPHRMRIGPYRHLSLETADWAAWPADGHTGRGGPCSASCLATSCMAARALHPVNRKAHASELARTARVECGFCTAGKHPIKSRWHHSRTTRIRSGCLAAEPGPAQQQINPASEERKRWRPPIKAAGRLQRCPQTSALRPGRKGHPSAHEIRQTAAHPDSCPVSSGARSAARPRVHIVSGRPIRRRKSQEWPARRPFGAINASYRPVFARMPGLATGPVPTPGMRVSPHGESYCRVRAALLCPPQPARDCAPLCNASNLAGTARATAFKCNADMRAVAFASRPMRDGFTGHAPYAGSKGLRLPLQEVVQPSTRTYLGRVGKRLQEYEAARAQSLWYKAAPHPARSCMLRSVQGQARLLEEAPSLHKQYTYVSSSPPSEATCRAGSRHLYCST